MKSIRPLLLAALACASARGQAARKEAALLPDSPGRPLVARECLSCHDSSNFRKARYSSQEWSDSVADMVERGARGTPAEIEAIVAYLAQNFGIGAPVRINTAPFAEIKSVLGFTVPETRALLDYREKNGPLKTLEDLAKVPGLDPAKLEAQKARIVF